jgi:phage putative head morphogenesis protein, SPP1 gp7 family
MTYWDQRAADSIGRMESAVNGALPELVEAFEQARRDLNNEVFKFYGKYAVNNKISLQEAETLLSLSELREFRGNLKEFEKLSRESIGTFNLQVSNLSTKARITRLQALQTQCDGILQKLYQERRKQIEGTAETVFTQQYYHQLFDIEQYTGFQFEFSRPAMSVIQKVIEQPVQGADISTHLWRQDIDTGFRIRQTLNNMFVTGRPPQDFADELQKAIGAIRVDTAGNVTGTGKKFEAYRLLYNESAHASSQADLQAYQDDDLNEYEYVATLDSHTSEICRDHDNKIYKVSEAVTGVNFPPLHVFCRSTTAPYVPNLKNIKSTRMARGADGKSVRVKDQSYEEWEKGKGI